jgi:enoyl-CoA hydratase
MGLVEIEVDGSVRVLTMVRPPVNALSGELLGALDRALDDAVSDPASRVLVLHGGPRAFSAGADIGEFSALDPEARRPWIARGVRLCERIAGLDKPTIAAIEGHCFGGGLELAMACHLRVAADTARLGQPEVKLGILPGFGGTQRLPRLVPAGIALEMLLTGESIDARRAFELGLVNRLVPSGEALVEAASLAKGLARGSASAQALLLRIVRAELGELDAIVAALGSPDAREGTRAFLEKRPPRFEGAPSA